jgi:hypothetical protein
MLLLTMALVSPLNAPLVHPLEAFRREWNSCGKKAEDALDYSAYQSDTMAFLDTLSNLGGCIDIYNPPQQTLCTCMADLDLTREEADETVEYLIKYFKMSFSEQRSLVAEWKKYSACFPLPVDDPTP